LSIPVILAHFLAKILEKYHWPQAKSSIFLPFTDHNKEKTTGFMISL